ncbi:glycosyltransferase family 4 protein, partial [Nostoc sp. NIES-2111]
FYPQSGGLQVHAEKLAHELVARGHQVTIVTRSISRTPSYQDYFFFSEEISKTTINGLSVDIIKHPQALNWLMWLISKFIAHPALRKFGIYLVELLFTQQLVKILQGVDVIHHVGQAHELIGFAAAAAASNLRVPFLVQPTLHPGQWGDSELDLSLYRLAKRSLVYTEYESKFLQEAGVKGAFDIVASGVDDRTDGDACRFRQKYGIDGSIILFLGRKTIDKGYPLIKAAFYFVRKQHPNVTLVCMGPSADKVSKTPEDGVLELGFGQEQDKHDALAACTLLCVPSEGESFGLVYMEAGRYAKPVIGRKLPVLEELLGQQEAALLVGSAYGKGNQVHVEPEELSDAILKILSEPELAECLGNNGYRVSGEFLWTKVVSRFEAAYCNAIVHDKNTLG